MKRKGYLIESIADIDNLRLAYWKAQKGKKDKRDVLLFSKNIDRNLATLGLEISTGDLKIGDYYYFKIFDPKERQICAASFRERVLHHAIMNVCHAEFESFQIFDSYACRKNKGTYAAIERAKKFTKQYQWYLKLDIRKYFDNINHQILKAQLRRKFKDAALLALFDNLIDSYELDRGLGLPIGNLTSQYFANHYLAVADHYAKEQLKAPAYVRYMDDIVIWHSDKNRLLQIGKAFEGFCNTTLKLELKQFCLNYTAKGLPFLGYLLFPNKIRLAKRSKKRFLTKLKDYEEKCETLFWNETEYQRHLLPLLSFVQKADTLAFRRKVIWAINEGY